MNEPEARAREDPEDPPGNGKRSRGEQQSTSELLPSAMDGAPKVLRGTIGNVGTL
jgi:hypothetical protein